MQFKDVIMPKFIKLEPNTTVNIRYLHEPGEIEFMRHLDKNKKIVDNIFCQHCEDEKIESRYEILDL